MAKLPPDIQKIVDTFRDTYSPLTDTTDVYKGLLTLYPDVKDLSFSNRIKISTMLSIMLEVWINHNMDHMEVTMMEKVAGRATSPVKATRTFVYSVRQDEQDDFWCIVRDHTTGEAIFKHSFEDLVDCGVMESDEDTKGLHQYLVHIGELLAGDTLYCSSTLF